MEDRLFRKESLEKMTSPEQMNDYIRVTGPGIWLVLAAVIALLTGALIWGALGRLDTTIVVSAVADENGAVVCYIPEEQIGSVERGMTVRIASGSYRLKSLPEQPVAVDGSFEAYTLHVGGLTAGQWVYAVPTDASLPTGVYEAEVRVDSVTPLSFVLN